MFLWNHLSPQLKLDVDRGSAAFAQLMAECPYTLQWAASSPFQNCLFEWSIWTPSNNGYFGSLKSTTQTTSRSV